MSSSSPNSNPDPRDPRIAAPPDSKETQSSDTAPKTPASEEKEAKAVETFSFDVSAGNKHKLDQSRLLGASAGAPAMRSAPVVPDRPESVGNAGPETEETLESAPVTDVRPPQVRADRRRAKATTKGVTKGDTKGAAKEVTQGVTQGANRGASKRASKGAIEGASGRAQPTKRASPAVVASPAVESTREASAKSIAAHPEPPIKRTRRGLPSSTISLIVHAAIIFLLSIYTLGLPPKEEELGLFTSTAAYEDVEDFQDLEIDPSEELDSLDTELSAELSDPGAAAFGDLSAESALADVSGDMALESDSLGDLGNLLGETGSGLADEGEGMGTAATASFFGTKVEGNRILYMLDNSGGMKGGKFETLVDELLKSVDSLQPKQQFYVIFYSDTVYPLFYPQPATDFVRGTEKNMRFLREWLDTVELCVGNSIDEALEAALVIRPDTVFLLTDGQLFTTEAKKRMLLDGAGREFPINTFGMGAKKNSRFVEELVQVAEANRGTYHAIDVSPDAEERAREKKRLSRNASEPGPIWGRGL